MKNFVIFLGLIILGCDKIDYVPDNPFLYKTTVVLMHRGNGANTDYTENTLPAALYGFSVLDGVELDIQISEEGTLWLDHGNEVKNCDGAIVGCFNEMSDEEIMSYSVCGDETRYYTLESVFVEMAAQYPTKYISLDIKSQYCDLSATKEDMQRMANAAVALTEKYGLQNHVVAESNSINFLEEISEENQPICQALVVLDDFDQGINDAYKLKARALSYDFAAPEKLTKESIELAHKKGFGMIVWVVNEPEDIADVWRMKPDIIQTDNPDFKSFIPDE